VLAASSAHLRDVAAGYRTRQENVVDILHVDGHRSRAHFGMGTPKTPNGFVHPPGDFFEGPEKKLEIEFTKVEGAAGVRKVPGSPPDLRALATPYDAPFRARREVAEQVPRYQWDLMLADCQCSILNVTVPCAHD
jgi:hypothetical protein